MTFDIFARMWLPLIVAALMLRGAIRDRARRPSPLWLVAMFALQGAQNWLTAAGHPHLAVLTWLAWLVSGFVHVGYSWRATRSNYARWWLGTMTVMGVGLFALGWTETFTAWRVSASTEKQIFLAFFAAMVAPVAVWLSSRFARIVRGRIDLAQS